MAHVHFKLPDDLVRDAREAGISIPMITQEAIRDALAGRRIEPPEVMEREYHGRDIDDADRYQQGYSAGEQWARTMATIEEIAAIAALRSSRWRDVGLDTGANSLGSLLIEEGEATSTADGKAWISRTPFTEGIIDAAAAHAA